MNAVQLISKKRDGGELTDGEIGDLIRGYVAGAVADYQMAAWAMAVFLRGMTVEETASLTDHMLRSGVVFEWPAGGPAKVDKHSTGGVGDKASLPLAPALAACGALNPMISGRGLGATGGTLDKLESIHGLKTDLGLDETRRIAEGVGCVICSASEQLAPADRKLYALRDVTGTVPSVPLITASIMSKKLAEGLDALVLDVKHGSGAFMKSRADARRLARSLVDTGTRMGVATSALVTDMNQPLGRMIGNTVEVDESRDCLAGGGPADLRELTVKLGGELLTLAGLAEDATAGAAAIVGALDSGAAMQKFREMVAAQGGDLDAPRPIAPAADLLSERAGVVASIETEQIGWAVITLGGGRKRLGDAIDHSVGLEMLVRIGDVVETGQPLARVFAEEGDAAVQAIRMIRSAIAVDDASVDAPPLVVERIG
ncbi:MAG: thymidine phosphorylase [Planctomycetota bacterium]